MRLWAWSRVRWSGAALVGWIALGALVALAGSASAQSSTRSLAVVIVDGGAERLPEVIRETAGQHASVTVTVAEVDGAQVLRELERVIADAPDAIFLAGQRPALDRAVEAVAGLPTPVFVANGEANWERAGPQVARVVAGPLEESVALIEALAELGAESLHLLSREEQAGLELRRSVVRAALNEGIRVNALHGASGYSSPDGLLTKMATAHGVRLRVPADPWREPAATRDARESASVAPDAWLVGTDPGATGAVLEGLSDAADELRFAFIGGPDAWETWNFPAPPTGALTASTCPMKDRVSVEALTLRWVALFDEEPTRGDAELVDALNFVLRWVRSSSEEREGLRVRGSCGELQLDEERSPVREAALFEWGSDRRWAPLELDP